MLSTFSPYVSHGLMPQFHQGLPQVRPGRVGQPGAAGGPGAYGVQAPLAPDPAQLGQPSYAFGVPMNPYLQSPFTPNQLPQGPQLPGFSPFLNSVGSAHAGGQLPAQQIVPVLAQLAQQVSIQSAVIQQLGLALHQLAQQVAAQGQGAGIGGQGFSAVPPFGIGPSAGGPFSGQNPFAGATQGGYGFNPQAQGWWAGNRSQTIQ